MNETSNEITGKQNMTQKLGLFRRLIVDTPHYQWIILLSVISGALSFLGIPLLIPILEYMQNGTTAQGSGFTANLLERLSTTFGVEFNFYGLLALATLLILAGEMLVIASTLIAEFASYKLIRDYSKNIFNAYLRVDWPWLVSTNSGEINYVVLQEAQFCANAHLCAQRLIISFVQCLVYLYIAILMSAKSVVMAVVIYGVLMIFNLKNARRVGDLANEVQDTFKKRISNILVGLQQNRKFLKTSLLNQAVVGRIVADIERIYRTHKSLGFRFELQRSWNFTAMFLFLIALILMNKQLGLEYASLLVLVLVFHRLSPQFNLLSGNYTHLQQYLPMYLSLNSRLKEMEVHEERIGSQAFDPKGDIRFDKVDFAYEQGVPVLRGMDLTIAARRSTAIVGGSGAGKTTVLDLVLGLLKPTRGTIYYGQIPHDVLDHNSLRSQIAYITQDPTLLDATLMENLTLGMPDATIEEVMTACRKVHLDDFIKQLPDGLNAMVGENGIKLSGGQKQRVVLARSILMNPSILILDEATSELDSETEKKIQQTIKELSKDLTVIIVAHRLSTVKDVDQVYVLEKGTIVESGNYQQLLEQKGRLYQLDLLQR